MSDLLTDGFRLLERIPIAEIEARIAWLENALASYKTMLIVRRLMDSKPRDFETPPEWEPLVIAPAATECPVSIPAASTTTRCRRSSVELRERIAEYLLPRAEGATARQLAEALGMTQAGIYCHLQKFKDQWYVASDTKPTRWAYCGNGTKRDWLAEQMNAPKE